MQKTNTKMAAVSSSLPVIMFNVNALKPTIKRQR